MLGSRALPALETPPASEQLQPWDRVLAPDREIIAMACYSSVTRLAPPILPV